MQLMDILEHDAGQALAPAGEDAHADYSRVAAQAPPEVLGSGIAEALRSGAGGDFASSVEKLFASSNSEQRAGILGQLIQAAGPAVLSSIAGGALAKFGGGADGAPVSPADAAAVTPTQAGELANAVRTRDPSIIDQIGAFYSQHPMVVKALGAAAVAIAMSHMAKRT